MDIEYKCINAHDRCSHGASTKCMYCEPDTITMTFDEYVVLVENQQLLYALQEAGVDNWEGYPEDVK